MRVRPNHHVWIAGIVGVVSASASRSAWAQTGPEPAPNTSPASSAAPVIPAEPSQPPQPPPPQGRPSPCWVSMDPCGHERKNAFELGGHDFLIPSSFPTSFVDTYFGIRLGAEFYEAPNLPTPSGTFSPATLASATAIDFGIKLTRWLGIFGNLRLTEILGSNTSGLVYSGAAFEISGEAGVILRLLRLEATGTQISVLGSGGYAGGLSISIFPLLTQPTAPTVRAVLQGDLTEVVRTPLREWDAQGNVAIAQALGPFFSLQGFIGGGVGSARIEPFDTTSGTRLASSETRGIFNAAAAFEVDGSPAKIPIAALVEYSLTRRPSIVDLLPVTSIDDVQTFSLGLYYSGRSHLQLGVVGGVFAGLPQLASDEGHSATPHSIFCELVMIYRW